MPRYAYVNGRYVPHDEAGVHIEDRGFQFADGVYEVCAIEGGRLLDMAGHMNRLERSLRELQIAPPMARRPLELVMEQLRRKNGVRRGSLYLQITRGVAPRDFKFPGPDVPSTLVMTTKGPVGGMAAKLEKGVAAVTVPDLRWARRDIKTVALLPQALAKQQAAEQGAYEAWMVGEDGTVTEGSSSTAWIVTQDGTLVTRRATHRILNGITRQSLIQLAAENDIPFEERAFTPAEAYTAREAFVSSASAAVMPIVSLDGRPIGNGAPGLLGSKLREAYMAYATGRPDFDHTTPVDPTNA